jgi:hypothetical protein
MKMSSIELGPQAPPHPPLGALLVQYGYIRQEDIDTILEYQSAQRIRFGEAAIRLGLVSVENVRFALSRQFEFAYLRPGREGSQIGAEVVSACDPFSGAADQIRSIRSQLMLHWFDKLQGRNALAILGAVEGEGRSYLAANLAVAFAQAGRTCCWWTPISARRVSTPCSASRTTSACRPFWRGTDTAKRFSGCPSCPVCSCCRRGRCHPIRWSF